MARRILVGYDGSDPSKRALEWALDRADEEDEIILLNIIPEAVAKSSLARMMPAGLELPPPLGRTFEENAQALLHDVVEEKRERRRVPMRPVVRAGDPYEAFVQAVRDFGVREVVIGHRSYESAPLPLGPIAEFLVRNAPATVTVVR